MMPKTKKKSKARVRRSAADSRELIIAAATKLFATNGVNETSFQNIADDIGVSQGAVMHHFPTKDSLFSACFAVLVQNNASVLSKSISEKDNAREKLIKHFKGTWKWLLDFPHDGALVTLLYYYASIKSDYAKLYEKIRDEARSKIETHLHAGIREGLFRKNLDTAEVAAQLHDYLLGTLVNNALIKITLGKNPPKKQFDSWIDLIDQVTKK